MEKFYGIIYIHKNKINGKCYVGQTTNKPKKRWGSNGINYKNSTIFWNAIQKYGWDNFEHIVLPTFYNNLDDLNKAESEMILELDSVKNGYNVTFGGENNKRDESVGERISEKLKGRTIPIETRTKMSESQKKKIFTKEHKRNISQSKNKPVLQIDRYTKIIINSFESVVEASEKTGTNNRNISSVCLGKRKYANNFIWKYKEKEEIL
jgi:group I intron endonuclease